MNSSGHRYFVIHKPYNMVSQFVSPHPVRLLGDLDFDFPEGTHAIGRLDNASEGLLLLTTNKKVTKLLFQGTVPHKRTYVVKAKNIVTDASIEVLRNGITFMSGHKEDYTTLPCEVDRTTPPDNLANRPGDYNDHPHTWLRMTLVEGKFHQIRKMLDHIRHRCQRLVRVSIEGIELGDLRSGEVRELPEAEFFARLGITDYE
ncbi:23S rRNA pseudouridine2457 synthase [Chitinophaga jiangningensis]|uniref:Pseudouridine synthase n=1 Tax=Chitinophaga jiangningensis TaxID=1419482 RepID=A0A1M7LK43_9BACT|nr:pseudouridine synthase [Chitinophaga jiangningensis]SHM78470.1 23S rRNA pseudouridine2457 synthase [Chitinophaga jiangningensis]